MVFLLTACVGLPPEIPNTPAVLTADNAPEVLSIASPDLPYLIYATLLQLYVEDFRTCPEYSGNSSAFTFIGDCSDSADISWEGNATWSTTGYTTSIALDSFGVSGLAGGWKASGSMELTTTRGSTGMFITSSLVMVQLDAPAKVYWIDTDASYAIDETSQILYADEYTGNIGIEDLGTMSVDGQRMAVANANGCDYAEAGVGSSLITGKNVEELRFHPVDDTSSFDACGCPTVLLEDTEVDSCATAKRAFTYPFFTLGS